MVVFKLRYFISLPVILFIALIASAAAQTESVAYFRLDTENLCWIKECKTDPSSFRSRVSNRQEKDPGFPSGSSHDVSSGFYLDIYPATNLDTNFYPGNHASPVMENQDFAFTAIPSEAGRSSNRYDLFRNEDKGIGAKLLRASAITHTAQGINLLLMIRFPDHFNYSIGSWAEAKSNLKRAWTTPPVWDKDPWSTNFIGHPYIGAFYYNMMRSQGASTHASILYSTGQSLIWEFVIEALAEQPSIQDLLFTSTLGSFMGEAAHRATLRLNRNGFSTFEKILVTFINPSYVLNNGYKKRHRTSVEHY